MNIEEELSTKLNIKVSQIKAVLKLLSEGSTIPFIARYRKEMTGNLNEDQIRTIEEEYSYQENLLKRKNDVIRLIDEKGLLTDELKNNILKCQKLTEIDDLYRPYQEKKKTKATEAIKMGLEPLAKEILSFPTNGNVDTLCQKYQIETSKAMENAGYILAEWISDNANYRKWIREYVFNNALITAKQKPKSIDEKKTYEMYYSFAEKLKDAKHFHILAINRGEEQKILNVNLSYDEDLINKYLQGKIIKNKNSFVVPYVIDNIKDALKRLILPSIEREIRAEVTKEADVKAIDNFEQNLGHLLLTRPIKHSIVLGFDPAFRTGCKLAVLDETGTPLLIDVIYPHEPVNKRAEAITKIRDLISKYHINLISIGNGTASRESESLVAEAIKGTDCKYIITSEAGASVYSASPLAKEEFPDLTVEKRSAISIGRRVQDPLSELVKIDPKSIGVGEYQHDVNQRDLADRLDFTVSKIVNEVGVNLNTASASILKYVSGLTKTTINHLLQNKPYKSRNDVEKVKGLSSKVYEQAIGFLRIPNSINPLDNTGIHPESYTLTNKILNDFNLDVHNINDAAFKKQVAALNANTIAATYHTDIYTVQDIIKELLNPGLDPRDSLEAPVLKSDILKVTDLKHQMELQGTVRNVTSFGAFIDIGLHNDALVHISKISKSYVKNINDYLKVGDIITCYVDTVDYENEHVGLTLIKE
jgi:protein Tex